MKRYGHYSMVAITVLLLIIATSFSNTLKIEKDRNALLNNIIESTEESKEATEQQLKAQIYFFKEVLDHFGAETPIEAANLWAKSRETRNGVFQYGVSCKKLKESLEAKFGKAEENFWNIGGSSPWVKKYELSNTRKLNNKSYEITVKYYWTTSSGDMEPTYDILTIIEEGKNWCVKQVL